MCQDRRISEPVIELSPSPSDELIERSNHLGSDPTNTNFGGGNISAKGAVTDPVSRDALGVEATETNT